MLTLLRTLGTLLRNLLDSLRVSELLDLLGLLLRPEMVGKHLSLLKLLALRPEHLWMASEPELLSLLY